MSWAYISDAAYKSRKRWINEICQISGSFGDDAQRVHVELNHEVERGGLPCLLDHIRLCGAMPESYGQNSSEEKLYSKYTDSLLATAFNLIGIRSVVLTERADAADVESFATDFSFVSDAKVFRLSRTAKNAKDFKVTSMDGWRRDKPFALLVAPINQLPSSQSQIYQQATSRNVLILSYSHLAALVQVGDKSGSTNAERLLKSVFEIIDTIHPSKDSIAYWTAINRAFLNFDPCVASIWKTEKLAGLEAIDAQKQIALDFLATERERLVRLSHEKAIKELLKASGIESKIGVIKTASANGLMNLK